MELVKDYTTEVVPIEITYKGKSYKGEAKPIRSSCRDGVCFELDIALDGEFLGTLHNTPLGWSMDHITDQDFVNTIGQEILLWYE